MAEEKEPGRRLRAVIDTNLFVSGLFGKGSLSAELQDLWIRGEFELVTSIEIMKEVSRVLYYPRIQQRFKPEEKTLRRFFRLVFRKAIITKDVYQVDTITEDPTDNKFLACALEAKADFIVSRDPHLRNLKRFQGIEIVDVRTFVERVKKRKITEKGGYQGSGPTLDRAFKAKCGGNFQRRRRLWHVFSATSTPLRNPGSPNPKLCPEYVDWII